MNIKFLLRFAFTLITLCFFMIGVYLIINGLSNSNNSKANDNGYIISENKPVENGFETITNNPVQQNSQWGQGISMNSLVPIDRTYSVINSENRNKVGYFDLKGKFNILYDLAESIEHIDIFNTAEIAFITKKDSFNQQKLVKTSLNLTEEVILPVNFYAKGFLFNIPEFTFYLYGTDQEQNFIIYALLNNDTLQEVIKTKSLPENTEIMSINSSNNIIVQAGSDCLEIKQSDRSFSKISCSSSIVGVSGYNILIENSNISLIDSNTKAKTFLFPKNSAVNYEKFWIANKKLYWLERPFTSPNNIQIYSLDIRDLKLLPASQSIFSGSINSNFTDLMFIGEKLFILLDQGVIIEKIIDPTILQSADFTINYRNTNWQDWYQLLLNVISVSEIELLRGNEIWSFGN